MYHHGTIVAIEDALTADECSEVLELNPTHEDALSGDYILEAPGHITNKIDVLFQNYLKEHGIPNLYTRIFTRVQRTLGNIELHTDLELISTYLRHFTVLVSLNGDDISGGELVFPKKAVIQPRTGMLIIFPIGVMYPHQVLPCLSDVRRYMLEPVYKFDYDHPLYPYIYDRPSKDKPLLD